MSSFHEMAIQDCDTDDDPGSRLDTSQVNTKLGKTDFEDFALHNQCLIPVGDFKLCTNLKISVIVSHSLFLISLGLSF